MINTEVRVVNEKGEDVAKNSTEIGEIIVKGNGVMPQENKSGKTMIDGWLYTGDMGTIDEQGRINVVKPKEKNPKKKISTKEMEHLFYKHPDVSEVAVIITPDKEVGETTHAVVVPQKNSNVLEKELLGFIAKKLPSSECPDSVTFVDELPKTVSGKILKIQLRDMV